MSCTRKLTNARPHDEIHHTQNTDHENLARAIFDELNDAYSRFEESGAQPLISLEQFIVIAIVI